MILFKFSFGDKRLYTILKSVSPKMNLTEIRAFEYAYFESPVKHVSHLHLEDFPTVLLGLIYHNLLI